MKLDDYLYDNPADHEKAVDQYLAGLKVFLMAPEHGDGEWPNIQQDALNEAHEHVLNLLQLKWGHDCDRDRPVSVRMWFRRNQRMIADWAMLDTEPRREETTVARHQRLVNNLRIISSVTGAAQQELDQVHRELDNMVRQYQCQAVEQSVFLVRYKKNAAWQESPHKFDYPASLHLSKEDAEQFQAEGYEIEARVLKKSRPGLYDSPGDNYAAYRAELAAVVGQVLPYHHALAKFVA